RWKDRAQTSVEGLVIARLQMKLQRLCFQLVAQGRIQVVYSFHAPRLRRSERPQGLEVASTAARARGNRDHGEIFEEYPGRGHRQALRWTGCTETRVCGCLKERVGREGPSAHRR